MKKAMTALTAFIAAACLLMTSCSDERLLRSVDDLIVPPLYYDEYGGLVETIQNDLGKDIRLCIPYEGDNRSAIIFNDIDGDGSEEAIVFTVRAKARATPECISTGIRIADGCRAATSAATAARSAMSP